MEKTNECESSKKLRIYGKLPVWVSEWHQDVLPAIHRALATKHLPSQGIKLVHLDSHPDLSFPVTLAAEKCFCPNELYDNLEIADWILPLLYEGHIDNVIWLKPPWGDQIHEGQWIAKIGEEKTSGMLRWLT